MKHISEVLQNLLSEIQQKRKEKKNDGQDTVS